MPSTFKISFGYKKARNQRCLPSFWVPRHIATDVVEKVLQKHLVVIYSLFTPLMVPCIETLLFLFKSSGMWVSMLMCINFGSNVHVCRKFLDIFVILIRYRSVIRCLLRELRIFQRNTTRGKMNFNSFVATFPFRT